MTTLCLQCGFDNPPGMKFCGNCGTRLDAAQAAGVVADPISIQPAPEGLGVMVGADLLERFRRAGLEARGQRRAVTVLFVDISGFTQLSTQLGDEDLYDLIQRFVRGLAEDVYRYEGMVDKLTGDGLMALFGAPIAYENNAERAVRSSLDMLVTVSRLSQATPALEGRPLNVHIGLNAGSVIVGGLGSDAMMNYTAIGDSVNLSRRLEEIAAAGMIFVSESVYRQTYRMFDYKMIPDLTLKGMDQAVTAYQVVKTKDEPGSARGLEGLRAPMVGRETELSRLQALLERLSFERQGAIVLLTGEGGMGKSRLTSELKVRVDPLRAQILEGHSLTYRKAIPYWIFQDVVRNLLGTSPELSSEEFCARLTANIRDTQAGDVDEIMPYLEVMMGYEPSGQEAERIRYLDAGQLRQRIFLAVRDLITAAARKRPMLLILEDLHWADDASVDLLLFLMDSVRTEPLLIYTISRPFEGSAVAKIAERGQQRLASRYVSIRLQALQPDQTDLLLHSLLCIPDLPDALAQQIVARAAGMPFFLEEIVRMLIEDGVLYQDGEDWRLKADANVSKIRVPDSLQSLILARFDRLDPDQRRVLQTAAVIGDRLKLPLLFEVLSDVSKTRQVIDVLAEREFLIPQRSADDHTYSFKNTLVSDAIYSTLLQRDRRELHTQVGLAIERLYAGRLDNQVEILASHFQRSPLRDRALRYLILAAQKAANAYAIAQARQLFVQAEEILGEVEHSLEQNLAVQMGLGDTLVTGGEYPAALEHYALAFNRLSKDDGAGLLLERSMLERKIATALERQGGYDDALSRLELAERLLEEHPGKAVVEQARILNDTGWIYFRRGDLEQAESILNHALALAEPAGQYDVIASILNRLGGTFFQRDQAAAARDYVGRSLAMRERIGDIVAVARTYNNLGLLDWKEGEWQSALEKFNRAYQLQTTLGDVEAMIELESNLGLLQIDRGYFAEAEKYLLSSLDRARQIGHSFQMGMAFLHLTLLYTTSGEWQRALDNGAQSAEIFNNIGTRDSLLGLYVTMGRAWLGSGSLDKADEFVRQAQAVYEELGGEESGRVDDYARLVYLMAEIALARGLFEQASFYYQRSMNLFEHTGDRLQRGRALLRLAEVAMRLEVLGEAREWLLEAKTILEHTSTSQDLQQLQIISSQL